jgi:hypothetical protein
MREHEALGAQDLPPRSKERGPIRTRPAARRVRRITDKRVPCDRRMDPDLVGYPVSISTSNSVLAARRSSTCA